MTRHLTGLLLVATIAGAALTAQPQSNGFFPVADVRPGMTGVGRTVFGGDTIEEFRVQILGVLRNVVGPNRDLVLAKLEGGPLAQTGVIQGMSGSPVYIDGRLLGAVSYSLGSFPKEPFAGITPIGEMTAAAALPLARAAGPDAGAPWPTTIDGVLARFGQFAANASMPTGLRLQNLSVVGPASLADLAPTLRPIGAAMVVSGLDPSVGAGLARAYPSVVRSGDRRESETQLSPASLRPGDPVGMSLVRGDLEMGATGTVTYVDGTRVYAFGHPFLNLGPTQFAMTRAHVYAVLPSLDISMKIAGLGPVVGTISQDRATGVAGRLGPGPSELAVNIALTSARGPERRFSLAVLHDEGLTPLFAYVAVYNALLGYERASGPLSIAMRGSVDYGSRGRLDLDDVLSGPSAIPEAAAAATASVGPAVGNDFDPVMPERLDLTLHVTEQVERLTIERAWLDTTRPRLGQTHELHVLLRRYRGGTQTITVPIAMPAYAGGPLTLLVSDAPTLAELDARELRPAEPRTWPALLRRLADRRQNNRLYIRLIDSTGGTAVAGSTLPALPPSVRSVLETDATAKSAAVSKTVVGSWDRRFDAAVTGSHQLTITPTPAR